LTLLLEISNESDAIISFAKLFERERPKDYLKIKASSFESLSIIDIIEIFARISRKSRD